MNKTITAVVVVVVLLMVIGLGLVIGSIIPLLTEKYSTE